MDLRRKTARLTIDAIPEILQKPAVFYKDEEVPSKIGNLSPLGVGLETEGDVIIAVGDIFYIRYREIDADIKCVCVYNEEDGNRRSIGAYFTRQEDQKIILKYMFF